MSNIKYRMKTDISIFEIKKELLGLWDLWVNSMPTLTFKLPEDAVNAVIQKKLVTHYGIAKLNLLIHASKLKIGKKYLFNRI